MALELKLNQKLSQSLVMTPQLQQAIKLLQLGRHEYLEVLEKELLENPVLEDEREDAPQNSDAGGNGSDATGHEAASSETSPTETPSDELDQTRVEIEADLKSFSENDVLSDLRGNTDWLDYLDSGGEPGNGTSAGASRNYESEDDRPSIETVASRPEGLLTHILMQLRTTDLEEEDYAVAQQIVGSLDRNGYLECSIEEIAEMSGCPLEDAQRVLGVIQTLDPPGIAARDLRECLLIQICQLGRMDTLVGKIVSEHLHDLELKKYDVIAKSEGVSKEEVYEAVKEIQLLEPRPGRPFVDEEPVYITPDIYLRKVGDEYVISLNDTGMPKLRLSPRYRELLVSGESPEGPDKEYLQDRVRSAAWLIKSIHQRQQTIFKVTHSIMKHQQDFLERGVSALKPLVLRDIAEDVGMHESTVSRVTTNKYVHTPQGVYELKYFFSSGLSSNSGEVSSESVKERIRQLISDEEPKKPLSDQAIVNTLKAEGIDIARRTVAKYREMMGILSSSRRKKVF